MVDWTDPSWLARATEWIVQRLDERGMRLTGSVTQPHVRPWSTVLRVPTEIGDLWFKANFPACAHEGAVVSALAGERRDCVPELLALDLERGWMLMGDGGDRLREVIEREHSLRRWLELLPTYGQLQIDVVDRAAELVRQGVPDRRLETLASQYEQLLEQLDDVPEIELQRLRSLTPRVREMCEELAGYGIPETVQHDDLHDGQVFVRNGRYLFFDWGDSCISHPFFSMSVTLEGQLAWGLHDVEDSEDIRPFRDAYLLPFTSYAARADLEAAHATALRLGWICRALNWHRVASALEPPHREETLKGVPLRLKLFLARLRE